MSLLAAAAGWLVHRLPWKDRATLYLELGEARTPGWPWSWVWISRICSVSSASVRSRSHGPSASHR
jgi:hypothetical protein